MSAKGRLTKQVYGMMQRMIAFGESKRALKLKAHSEGKPFWCYYAGKVFSIRTYKTYYSLIKTFTHWCVDHYGIRSVYQITPRMFKAFIRSHISIQKPGTLSTYLCALAKFGEGRAMAEAFRRTATQLRKEIPKNMAPKRPRFRNWKEALRVGTELERRNSRYGLAYLVELDSACRVCELEFGREALRGLTITDHGETVGLLHLIGKGGKERDVTISEQTYQELDRTLEPGRVLVNAEAYRKAVYRVQKALGFRTFGTHKIRRTSAYRFFSDQSYALRATRLTSLTASATARSATAERLGHVRPGITQIYLRP